MVSPNDPLKLLKVIGRFRQLYADISLAQVMVFLYVASNDDVRQSDIWQSTDLGESLVSRCAATLGADKKKAAVHLIRARVGEEDRRERFLSLTPAGRQLMEDIERDLT